MVCRDPVPRGRTGRLQHRRWRRAEADVLVITGPSRGVETGREPAALIAELTAGYRNVLSGISATAPRVTDKNPYNVRWMPLIHLAFPNARFIHCRRHPVDTCLSIYTTLFTARTEFASSRADLVFYYRQYQQLSDRWRSIIPADRQLELDYETLVADREAQTKRLIAFCGLIWDNSCLAPERNHRAVQTASVWQARQPVYTSSVGRWRRYKPWLGELRELLKEADG